MLPFLLLERTWPVIIPRLLSTARRMSLSPQQFSEDFLNSSFNLNDHVEYCSHYKNESCFLVATYFINQNGNYQKRDLISAISRLFEKCASTNQHCADILVQLEYFHTPNITIFDALKIYDHYQSDSIFCHLLHIALHYAVDFVDYENYLLINQITRLAFLEYTADPLRAKINTEYIDSIIKEDNILKIERIMDKFLISSKTWQEIPDSDNYLLKYSRVRQLFLNDLNKKADSAGSIGQTMKILLENDNPNTTNYTYILNNCYKKQSKFNTQLSAIIQLFGLANGTRASDAVPLIKSLSDDGDIFFSELAIFLNLFFEDLKMPEIGLEYDYFEDGLIEAFIDDVSLRNSSISKKYVDLRKFLDVSPVFSDIIVAEEMMREGHWDSAQFLLERMSLMGNCHALKLLKYITSKRKMDINQVLKLEKLFCNSTTENKFYKNKHLDPKILSIIDKYPISSYYYSHNSEPPEVARAYYSYAVEKNNESLFKRINRRISLEIDILIQQTYEGMFIEMSFSTKFVIVITFIFLIIKVANNVKTQLFDNNQRPVFLNVNPPVPKPARVN